MNNQLQELEEMEQETRLEIIRLEDDSEQNKAKKIIDAINKEFEKWFSEAKQFINEQKDSEKIQEAIAKVRLQTTIALEKTKETLASLKDDDKVQDVIEATKETFINMKEYIVENDAFNKVKNNVSETIIAVKNDEKVQAGVKKAKKSVLNVAEKALSSIQKALQEEEKE